MVPFFCFDLPNAYMHNLLIEISENIGIVKSKNIDSSVGALTTYLSNKNLETQFELKVFIIGELFSAIQHHSVRTFMLMSHELYIPRTAGHYYSRLLRSNMDFVALNVVFIHCVSKYLQSKIKNAGGIGCTH